MAEIKLKGKTVHTAGNFPTIHTKAPNFHHLIDQDLKEHTLAEYNGKRKLISTVPSLDTGVCNTMTKHLNELAKKNPDFVFITVSADLPFAQKRFCEHEGVQNVITLSNIRDHDFGKSYGVLIEDGPLQGMLARALLVLDEKDHVLYEELVPEITQEPNYHKALEFLKKHR